MSGWELDCNLLSQAGMHRLPAALRICRALLLKMAFSPLHDSAAGRRPATARGKVFQVAVYYIALSIPLGLICVRGGSPALVVPSLMLMLLSLLAARRFRPPFSPPNLKERRQLGLVVLICFSLALGVRMFLTTIEPEPIFLGLIFWVVTFLMVRDCRRVLDPAFVYEPPPPGRKMDFEDALKFKTEEW